jgi:O-antigen/teichoic acid export membrane protein
MSLGQNMRHGIAWMFIGNTGKQVLGFLFGIVLARLLVPGDFGTLLTIQVFTGLAGFVAGGGMGQALVRAESATREDYDIVFTLQIITGSLIYVGFFIAAPWLAKWYDTPLYTPLLRISALSFLFRPFVNLPGSILHRQMRYKAQAIVNINTLITASIVSIAMAYLGYGVWSLIWGGMAGSLTSMLMLIPLAKWRPGLSFDFRRGRGIARYGMLTSFNDIVLYLRKQVSIFILSRTLGPSSVGLYNKGESLAGMPHGFITGSVYHVLFRAMAAEQNNLDKCRYLFHRSITLVAVYATPFYVGLLWLAEPLIRGVYGEKWAAAAGPLMILAFAWPFWLMDNLSGAVLAARNWLGRELPVQISTLVISALGVSIAVLIYASVEAVAWAIVCTAAYSSLHLYSLATRCLQARATNLLRALWPAVLLNLLLAVVLFSLSHLLPEAIRHRDLIYLAVMGTLGGLFYVLAFLYLPIRSLHAEQQRWKVKLKLCAIPA